MVEIYVAILTLVVTKTGNWRLTVPEATDLSTVTVKNRIRITEIG